MAQFKKKKTSLKLSVISETYPKGKSYMLNNVTNDATPGQISEVCSAFETLASGNIAETEIHRVDAVVTNGED